MNKQKNASLTKEISNLSLSLYLAKSNLKDEKKKTASMKKKLGRWDWAFTEQNQREENDFGIEMRSKYVEGIW